MTFLLCVMYILLFALVTIINYLLTYLLIKTRASREITSRKNINIFYFNGGERCQALACGGARYLPSLIALFNMCYIR